MVDTDGTGLAVYHTNYSQLFSPLDAYQVVCV